ncbi:hypothetical protein VTI74DRAFT_3619 [Chaetomium olivicolor]
MEDGSVFVHHISGVEPDKQLLFIQTKKWGAHSLCFNDRDFVLACGDRSGRFTARKIARPNNPWQRKPWEVGLPLVDGRTQDGQGGVIRQILLSSKHERMLVSMETLDMLWSVPKRGEGMLICQVDSGRRTGSQWISRPRTAEDVLIFLDATGQELKVYEWATLTLVRMVSLSLDQEARLDQFTSLDHPHFFATYTTTASKPGVVVAMGFPSSVSTTAILLWDYQKFEEGAKTLTPMRAFSTLPSRVAHIIGSFGNRLVLFTTDNWIASVELQQPGAVGGALVESSFLRHFFLPNDWVGSMVANGMIFGIGKGGEIFLARGSELAVIKRGLEVTEDTSTTHPRRLNNLRPLPGSRMPYQPRASSSIS